MKTKSLLVLLLLGIGLIFNTCSKDDGEKITYEVAIQLEALSEEEAVFWDNQESLELDVNEVLLPNGLTVEEFLMQTDQELKDGGGIKSSGSFHSADRLKDKNLLIIDLIKAIEKYTNRENFQYPAIEGGPQQDGLAYSFGQKDHTIRIRPPNGECIEKIYGLDCSGLIYRIFFESGINLMDGNETYANYQRKPSVLENAIKRSDPKYDKIKVKDLGEIDPEDFESGDIIYWLTLDERGILVAFHIGIVCKNREGELAVAQSNGTRYMNGCAANYGPGRGPGFKSLLEATLPKGSGGLFCNEHGYGIVRIGVDIPDPPDYNRISLMIKANGYYTGSSDNFHKGIFQTYSEYTGGFTENVFKANGTFTYEMYGSHKITGSITAHFNSAFDTINSLTWSQTHTKSYYSAAMPASTETMSCEVVKIPYIYDKIFEVEGEDACKHIQSLDDDYYGGDVYHSLVDHECTWESDVFIHLDKK